MLLLSMVANSKRAARALFKPICCFLGRTGIDFSKEGQKVDAKRRIFLEVRRALCVVFQDSYHTSNDFIEPAVWKPLPASACTQLGVAGTPADGGTAGGAEAPKDYRFDQEAYVKGWKAHTRRLLVLGNNGLPDPDVALCLSIFEQCTEIAGYEMYCAHGLAEPQYILRKHWTRRWAAHGKFTYAVNEIMTLLLRLFRPWRVNMMSMAHAAWAVTGKFESQSPGDEVQEQLVAATKAQVPKNLPPSLYFTTMLLASLACTCGCYVCSLSRPS